nr:RHS repeat domain-containing protein [uncultured Desulfobulbus sp.]
MVLLNNKSALLMIVVALIGSAIPAHAITYIYDQLNRLTKVTYDNKSSIEYSYDSTGNIVSVSVNTVLVDSDSDGIEDSWELSYFANLDIANSTTDFDKDGYTDIQEYLNFTAGQTDPNGIAYNPTVINAPGGTGYVSPQSDADFWNLMIPSIIAATKKPIQKTVPISAIINTLLLD